MAGGGGGGGGREESTPGGEQAQFRTHQKYPLPSFIYFLFYFLSVPIFVTLDRNGRRGETE